MKKNQISCLKTVFHGRILPEEGYLVGYAALVDAYALSSVPLLYKLSLISHHHKRYDTENCSVYTPRYRPQDTISGHLTFALRYEGLALDILHALFMVIEENELTAWITTEPTSRYSRCIWFLYEWLMNKTLPLPDTTVGNYVPILDPTRYFTGPNRPSKRHRIKNNLPGVRDFCPLVRRTLKLEDFIQRDLKNICTKITTQFPRDLLSRAATFMVLKDSRASFAIEGESPPQTQVENWADVLRQAGKQALTLEELLRLQDILITNNRFLLVGLRNEGGFIGIHDRVTSLPIPEHISARWQDLIKLLEGLLSMNNRLKNTDFDPVILAAMISFGFVFIHPFIDGNGRLHRYLMHHIMAEKKFSPPGIIFPVSAIILENIEQYKEVLESYSRPRLKCIQWQATPKGNVEVLNDTIDLYRYFDATLQAEFLYECVLQTIEEALPAEIDYLEKYDRIKSSIKQRLNMPEYLIDLLIKFLGQNKGKLSKRARSKEFIMLSDKECLDIEQAYAEIFFNSLS